MHRTAYPALSSSGTSRPPMYPEAPVTRQRSGDDMLSSVTRARRGDHERGAARPAPSRARRVDLDVPRSGKPGTPQVMPPQMLIAQAQNHVVPVGGVTQNRRRNPATARAGERAGIGLPHGIQPPGNEPARGGPYLCWRSGGHWRGCIRKPHTHLCRKYRTLPSTSVWPNSGCPCPKGSRTPRRPSSRARSSPASVSSAADCPTGCARRTGESRHSSTTTWPMPVGAPSFRGEPWCWMSRAWPATFPCR